MPNSHATNRTTNSRVKILIKPPSQLAHQKYPLHIQASGQNGSVCNRAVTSAPEATCLNVQTSSVQNDQFSVVQEWHYFAKLKVRTRPWNPSGDMTMTYSWHESYKTAVFETDWTKMQERLKSAERAIKQRQHVLSMDHGGTPQERQAIANALNGMKCLRTEVAEWQNQQVPDGGAATSD